MPLLIRNATLDGRAVDCLIDGGVYTAISPSLDAPHGAEVLDAGGDYIVPPFFNAHTHIPMNLFRGLADDIPLMPWLKEHIWPAEAKLTAADIRRGARLAIDEMVRSGTVFFNDLYWHAGEVVEAAAEGGLRAAVGPCLVDEAPGVLAARSLEDLEDTRRRHAALPPEARRRIHLAYAPHAVYTVSGKSLEWIARRARDDDAFLHVHASETKVEFDDCLAAHGMTPVAWLDKCGALGPKTILAHCVWLTDGDRELIAERGCTISHQPCSNAKLCSGAFDYRAAVERAGCRLAIGTDGCASNNNLSMFDEMKFAALNAKAASGDPSCGKAADIFRAATRGGAEAFGLDGGRIAVGALGDALLIRRDAAQMTPCTNLVSNLVYAADTSCVAAVVCDGKVLFTA